MKKNKERIITIKNMKDAFFRLFLFIGAGFISYTLFRLVDGCNGMNWFFIVIGLIFGFLSFMGLFGIWYELMSSNYD